MTLRIVKIELRFDFDSKEKEELMIKDMRFKAHELVTTAALLADKRKPEVVLHSDDFFEGREEIALFVEENGE